MHPFSLKAYLTLFEEIMIGRTGEYTWVIDRDPGQGILRSLQELSGKEASTPLRKDGISIASHAGHVNWALDFALTFMSGETPTGKWPDSWKTKDLDEEDWLKLLEQIEDRAEAFRDKVKEREDWSDVQLETGVLAFVPHMAYHLGAIRQLLKELRERNV